MCGIVGFIEKKNNEQLLTRMMNSIKHRGPDAEGVYIKDGMHLGSKRLSIQDLSENGRMPMYSKDGQVIVAQNGEIYNYPELKKELETLGYSFFSRSDTEAIIIGYQHWGMEVFKKLRGMFAVSLLDLKNRKFFLVRDRLGIKPVYYMNHHDGFYYSSEVKAFNEIDGFSMVDALNYDRVRLLLGFMFYPDSTNTMMEGVKKLEAGHYLEMDLIDHGGVTINKYWDLNYFDKSSLTFEDAKQQLEDLLVESVKMHMLSDVPVGVMLSGGLDSSIITAIAQKHYGNIHTFNAKFDHPFNESDYAQQVATHLGTVHNEIFIDAKEVASGFANNIQYYDDLTTFDGGLVTTKILCHKIKEQGYTVVLLGEGSDEIFGGYSWFGLSKLPMSIMPNFVKSAAYYYAITRNLTHDSKFLYGFFAEAFNNLKSSDTFRKVSELEIKLQLPNHLLLKVDKGSMAASVEARVPFMDHKVVEFVFSLPAEYKLRGNYLDFNNSNEKYILREISKNYLPNDIVHRKKRGFMMPMLDVLNTNISGITDLLKAKDSIAQRFFSITEIDAILSLKGSKYIKMQKEYLLWRLYLLELWKNAFKK